MKREARGGKPSFIIVGAGPAGLTLGILLARRGHSALILEREPGPHRQVCGEYLSPQGVSLLAEMGLDKTTQGFRPLWGMKMSSPGGRSVLARFPEKRLGLAINRQQFLTRLRDEFASLGGLVFYGESLVSLEKTETGFRLESNNNIYTCESLIGADGRSSQVAKLLGMERSPSRNPRVAIHAYLKPVSALSPFGQMHILPGGSYAGINPISADEVNFSIVADAALVKEWGNAKNLLNFYIRRHPLLSRQFRLIGEEPIKTTYPIDCHREKIVNGRAALVGDASGFIDPLTGEGITTALKTARLMAEKIDTAPSMESAFASYAIARGQDWRQKENLNRALQLVIRRHSLCEAIAIALRAFPRVRSLFIGVIGNIYTPGEAFRALFLGGRKYGQNNIGAERFSEVSPHAERSHEASADRLA